MKMTIALINYGMGNLGSILAAFQVLGAACVVSSDPVELAKADAYILPGVGAFPQSMHNLTAAGLDNVLRTEVLEGCKPFLGICLGMQLLADDSSEQEFTHGLGFIGGHILRLEPGQDLRVPHVGWNQITFNPLHPLFQRIEPEAHFYFDHSYHFQTHRQEDIAAICQYGSICVAAISRANIHAVQFHPEKSQRNGLKLLRNFLNLAQAAAEARHA